MSVMASRPVVRWAVPAGVVAAVLGAAVLSNSLRASASVSLPQRSPAQLLVDLQQANLTGVSGTVIENADLGLPALPDSVGGDGSADLNALVTGSHTMRVWYSGPDKLRVALIGALAESDIVRNGSDAWIWSSKDKSAEHFTIKDSGTAKDGAAGKDHPQLSPSGLPFTPDQAAGMVLGLLNPTTEVTTEDNALVAGRPAYLLSVAPRDTNSLIAKIVLAIDGTEHVPTRVEVFAKDNPNKAAFSIGFSQVTFSRPDDERFAFTPPAGTKVTEGTAPGPFSPPTTSGVKPKTATIGTGWTTVFAARVPAEAASGATTKQDARGSSMDAFLNALPKVHGSWGSGRLLQSRLFSVLLTDDGRILAGAVSGNQLQSAAADPAAALK
jgi:outer membrane lipoprotein-sorting protein